MSWIPISSMQGLRVAQDENVLRSFLAGISSVPKNVYFKWHGKTGKIIGRHEKQLRVQFVNGIRLLPPEVIKPLRVQLLFRSFPSE